ncbi:MAG: hypothetical protein ACYCY9_05655 [Thiobacillus sp.]
MLGFNSLAWLGLLVWVGVPLFALVMGLLLWRRSRTVLHKGLVVIASVVILSMPALVSNGVKAYYDRQVRELCVKDGGVRVYETARLPAEKFDELKRVNFVLPDKTRAEPADEYYSETDRHYYRKGNPEFSRRQYRIIRRSDQKILGELVFYGRGGGDLPGPWHGSSFTCPDPTQVRFESTIFVKGDKQ